MKKVKPNRKRRYLRREGRLEEARGALVNVMTAVGDLAHANHE